MSLIEGEIGGTLFQIVRFVIKISCAALVLVALGGSAWGDTVDGEWCSADGRRLIIDGADITTPDGSKTTGNYDAHHYLFTMPISEQNGGAEVDIVLVMDDTVHIRYLKEPVGETALRPERWIRCKTKISTLPGKFTRLALWIAQRVQLINFTKASMNADRRNWFRSWRLLSPPLISGSRNDDW